MLDFLRAALPWLAMGAALAVWASKFAKKEKTPTDEKNDETDDGEDTYMTVGMCLGMSIGMIVGGAIKK